MTGSQVFAQTLIELAKLGLIGYGIFSAQKFLMRWLDTRQGLPLFTTARITKKAALDAARKHGITDEFEEVRKKVA